MAVVFISPKKRQNMFLMGIIAGFALFLAFVFLTVFLSKPGSVSQELVFNKPKVTINMDFLDSEKFSNLEKFEEMKILFSYKAFNRFNVPVNGFVSAESLDEASKILKARGLFVSDIRQAESGRDNPFTPYYQQQAVPVVVKTETPAK